MEILGFAFIWNFSWYLATFRQEIWLVSHTFVFESCMVRLWRETVYQAEWSPRINIRYSSRVNKLSRKTQSQKAYLFIWELKMIFWVLALAFFRPVFALGESDIELLWPCVSRQPDFLLRGMADHQSMHAETLCWYLENQRIGVEYADFGLHQFHNIFASFCSKLLSYKGGEDKICPPEKNLCVLLLRHSY